MLLSFARRETYVNVEGRALLVRPPTCLTVLALLDAKAVEIGALWHVLHDEQEKNKPDLDAIIRFCCAGARMIDVLATVCEVTSGDSAAKLDVLKSEEARYRVACASLSLCHNPESMVESLELGKVFEQRAEEETEEDVEQKVDEQAVAVFLLAAKFGKAPHEILDWPYEEFLAAIDVYTAQAAHQEAKAPRSVTARQAAETQGVLFPGFSVSTPPAKPEA